MYTFYFLLSSCHPHCMHSQSYQLQTSREIHPSITLEPLPNYNSPKFRSRNQSYMRAVSTLSQASCVSQVSQVRDTSARLHYVQGNPGLFTLTVTVQKNTTQTEDLEPSLPFISNIVLLCLPVFKLSDVSAANI